MSKAEKLNNDASESVVMEERNVRREGRNLRIAQRERNDEFYTCLPYIQSEMNNYTDKFENKAVFCNCDDPFESNFVKYFLMNFNRLKLKELIATGYKSSPIIGDEFGTNSFPYILRVKSTKEYLVGTQSDLDSRGSKYFLECEKQRITSPLFGDEDHEPGDFRSKESIELLKESDIVVTNPPFSLFREFIAQLMLYGKKFIILGNMNAITYKEVFPLLQTGKLWIGYGFNMSLVFKTQYPNLLEANRKFVIQHGYNPDEGYVKTPAICWYTNVDHLKRHQLLTLNLGYKYYGHENMYKRFYNFDGINVDKVNEIPCDYDGIMGVPITWLDKFCPEQFEIIGLGIANLGLTVGVRPYEEKHRIYRKTVQKKGTVDGDLYMVDENDNPVVPYARILIKFKDSYIESHQEQFERSK